MAGHYGNVPWYQAVRITAPGTPESGWELHPYFGAPAPQDARDSMGAHFRRLAQAAGQAGDEAAHAECLRAAGRMDGEALDEATVLGARYRVVRAEQFIRFGATGPEPPRPADPDPGEPDQASPTACSSLTC